MFLPVLHLADEECVQEISVTAILLQLVCIMVYIMAFGMWSFHLMLSMTLKHEVANELILFSMS